MKSALKLWHGSLSIGMPALCDITQGLLERLLTTYGTGKHCQHTPPREDDRAPLAWVGESATESTHSAASAAFQEEYNDVNSAYLACKTIRSMLDAVLLLC